VRATDLQSGLVLDVDTYESGKGSVRVQEPAQPVLGPLVLSQATVTTGQTQAVQCDLEIRNGGEASLDCDLAALQTLLTTTPPVPATASLASGDAHLAAGESLTLRWQIGPFAVPPGPLALAAAPRLVEPNRDLVLPAAAAETLLVQSPAQPVVTTGSAPGRITAGQTTPWQAAFTVENRGASALRIESPQLVLRTSLLDVSPRYTVVAPRAFDAAADLLGRLGKWKEHVVNERNRRCRALDVEQNPPHSY